MSSPRLRIKRGSSGMKIIANEVQTKKASEVTATTTPRPGPLSKKSKGTKIEMSDVDEEPTRVQRFIRQMKDPSVREGYIKAVDKHVDKLLESVRDRRSESTGRGKRGSNFSSRKPSQATQIAETTKRIDLTSADSILGHVKNPRVLLNPTSFASLPLFYQYKLVKMLPSCDQLIGKSGWVKPSAFSLTNEFFTKACSEWCDSLKEGKFNPEILTRRRMEIEKEKSKLDPFKLKHFEPIWGAKLESAIDHRSEYDRIPRTVEFLISPSSFFTQACPQQMDVNSSSSYLLQESIQTQSDLQHSTANGSSDETDIDNDVGDSTQSDPEFSESKKHKLSSPSSDKPLKSILKKPKMDGLENGIIIDYVQETPMIEVTSVSPEKSPSSASKPTFKVPSISITPIVTNPIIDSSGESPSKRVRIQSDDNSLNVIPVSVNSCVPPSISLQEIVQPSSSQIAEESPTKGKRKGSPTICDNQSPSRRMRTPGRGNCNQKAGKNSLGVDEIRSLLICKEAVERSVNNKLFYAQNGKIHTLTNAPANSGVQPINNSSNTCNGSSSIGFIAADIYGGNGQLPVKASKLFNDVEITPVTNESTKAPREPTPIEITVQDIRDQTEMTLKPSILSNYLSQKQKNGTPVKDSTVQKSYDRNVEGDQIPLPYKLPNGITITPFSSECSMSQVPVITHSSANDSSRQAQCQDLVRLPSQITVIPLGIAPEQAASVQIASSTPSDEQVTAVHQSVNVQASDCHPTMICNEVAQHAAMMVGQATTTATTATILNASDLCACDGKAFTPCVACGSFCHADCIGPSRLCVNCLVRVNSYNANPQATAISVIAAPNHNPGSGQTTAYFCHI